MPVGGHCQVAVNGLILELKRLQVIEMTRRLLLSRSGGFQWCFFNCLRPPHHLFLLTLILDFLLVHLVLLIIQSGRANQSPSTSAPVRRMGPPVRTRRSKGTWQVGDGRGARVAWGGWDRESIFARQQIQRKPSSHDSSGGGSKSSRNHSFKQRVWIYSYSLVIEAFCRLVRWWACLRQL